MYWRAASATRNGLASWRGGAWRRRRAPALDSEGHLGQRLLQAGDPPVLDRPEPVPGRADLVVDHAYGRGSCRVPGSRLERGAVRLPGAGEDRAVPGKGQRDGAGGRLRAADAHRRGVADSDVGDLAVVGRLDGPFTVEQGSPR